MSSSAKNPLLLASLLSLSAMALSCGTDPASDPCTGRVPGDLVITEFLADPDGADEGKEYVELYNATDKSIPLKGLSLHTSSASGAGKQSVTFEQGDAPPREFVVVSNADAAPGFATIAVGAKFSLGNSSGIIKVMCGEKLIDQLTYTKAVTANTARVFDGSRAPDALANDDEANWCDATTQTPDGFFGAPKAANPPCATAVTCEDTLTGQTRPIVPPQAGDIVITELMPNPKTLEDNNAEWIELLVKADVDLNGLEVGPTGGKPLVVTHKQCLRVGADSYVVVARKADPALNGGLTELLATFSFSLNNTAAEIAVSRGGVTLDKVSYEKVKEGYSLQLSPSKLDAVLNDAPDAFCNATRDYHRDATNAPLNYGTPGAPNSDCAGETPNQCLDDGVSRPINAANAGDLIITEYMANPKAVADTSGEWIEIYATREVDLNGVRLTLGSTNTTLSSPNCLTLGASSYAVLARKADSAVNGGLPPVVATFSGSLTNSGGQTIALSREMAEIDAIVTAAAADGASTQLSADKLDQVLNDDTANWCAPTGTYGGGDQGTPGTANRTCP